MSEVKKIATRESYGNALAELGKEFDNLVVLDADLAAATKTGIFKKAFPERHIDCGNCRVQYDGRGSRPCHNPEKFRLPVHSLCLRQEEPLNRFATPLDIHI